MVVPPSIGEAPVPCPGAHPGPERRSADRPWANRPVERPAPGRDPAPSRRVATGGSARTTVRRRVLHGAVGLAGWVLFAALWAWQLEVHVPERWFYALALIGLWLGGWAVATPVWIWWNRSIYRRRHRRTESLVQSVDFTRDALGREVIAAPEVRLNPSAVIVSLARDGAAKRYAVAPRAAAGPQPAGHGLEKTA